MNELFGSGAIITLVVLCIKLSNGVVRKGDCHRSMDTLNDRLDDLKEFLHLRFEDLKEFIKK